MRRLFQRVDFTGPILEHYVGEPEREAIDNQHIEPGLSDNLRELDRFFDGREILSALGAMMLDARGHFPVGGLRGGDEGPGTLDGASLLQRIPALPAARAAADEDYSHRLLRFDRSSQMKNGPPANAVTTPTGISVGAMTVRDSVSHTAKNAAPSRNEHGNSSR